MAGGPTTAAMVIAAVRAGSIGFVAGGYKSAEELAAQLLEVRAGTAGGFGVNLFAPNPLPVDPLAYRRYAGEIQVEADRFSLDLAGTSPREDEDRFDEKVALLVEDPVPMVTFTFAIPGPQVMARLRGAGSVLVQTVTSVPEARAAEEAGVDVLAVQGSAAGGHWGTFTPDRPPGPGGLVDLVGAVCELVRLPVIAAGGLATPADVAPVMAAGAAAVMVGTVLLLTDESGASAPYRTALANGPDVETVVTRAFTGRPARGMRNRFIDRFDALAPIGYPAVHYLTSPLRRAATGAGDAGLINLWAGTGHRHARPGSVAATLEALAARL
jgi:NAD(P)H-dependent flavin oxidoreductase YrpB (nitropropane dioxygenase family)